MSERKYGPIHVQLPKFIHRDENVHIEKWLAFFIVVG
jgi:hypothetical protein